MKRRIKAKVSKKKAIKMVTPRSKRVRIKILFPFDRETLQQVKQIPGRKYHPKKTPKYWSAPLSLEAVNKLKDFGFEVDQRLVDRVEKTKVDKSDLKTDVKIPGLKGDLFPFQSKGVSFLEIKEGRALLADEMGLGKTVQALAWLQKNPDKRPAIIVCPASLKINWQREAENWMPDPQVQILSGTKADELPFGEILIINYDIVKNWEKRLKQFSPKVVIFDEVHYIKNNKAQRTKASKKVARVADHVIGLTGTPIVNRPSEILNAIQLIDRAIFPNRWSFLHRYCGAKHNGFGWDFSGASNTKELHEKLTSTVMIRRLKKDVLKDLPDKVRSFIPLELNNSKEYAKAENDFINFVKDKTENDLKLKLENQLGDLADMVAIDSEKLEHAKHVKAMQAEAGGALVQIEALKQICVQGKLDQAVSWIKDFLESDQKLVIMAVHKFVINRLLEEFGREAVKVDGSVSGKDRNLAVERFQKDDKVKLFVGNIKAAGVGLTLTAASSVAFLELPWTPGDLNQAEDRVHRIGQKESVNIYYLLAQDTIEEKIASLIDEKRKVLDAVLDGRDSDQGSLISQLIDEYKF